eukprot:TRINITY_DN33480_c0_g1_i1.p1 TRINITY_DN33480_c0_g1~~TRINITY_DN33480_c0_g1_i1.p1  ORF type:complete len:294 (-),score=29.60 TRINITY_DN33480_c0_g1_i1:86-967(-)
MATGADMSTCRLLLREDLLRHIVNKLAPLELCSLASCSQSSRGAAQTSETWLLEAQSWGLPPPYREAVLANRAARRFLHKRWSAEPDRPRSWFESLLRQRQQPRRRLRVCVCGLPGAGVSRVLHAIRSAAQPAIEGRVPTVMLMPQVGVEWHAKDDDLLVTLPLQQTEEGWRPIGTLLGDCDGAFFLVDASNGSKFREASEALRCVLDELRDPSVPVFVMLNKQDLPGARDGPSSINALGLRMLMGSRPWLVQPSSLERHAAHVVAALDWFRDLVVDVGRPGALGGNYQHGYL